MIAMPSALEEVARLDRRWFRARTERQHGVQSPDTCEVDLCDNDRDTRPVLAVRHLDSGYIVC
jgi:hypothetical protein